MNSLPTTTITILGPPVDPTATDRYGDPVEDSTPVATGIPMALAIGQQTVQTTSDQATVTVQYATGRLPAGTQVTDRQRIRDERTGQVWLVDSVTIIPSAIVPQDVRLTLRRVI